MYFCWPLYEPPMGGNWLYISGWQTMVCIQLFKLSDSNLVGSTMEGSVESFLKAEWKVSDTGSAHWASSLFMFFLKFSLIQQILIVFLRFLKIFKFPDLATRIQRRFDRNRPIRNKNCLWRPCLLTYQDEMSILNRGPSIDASYQVLVHFRGEDFFKSSNQKEESWKVL
jgi:hypothetical protein